MTYKIIPMNMTYLDSFQQAVAAVSHERLYLLNFEGFSVESTRAFIAENCEKGLPHYVAIDGDQVVGWCDLRNSGVPVTEHLATVGMGVIASHRGKGIGESLLRKTIQAGYDKKLARIDLTVRTTNIKAIKLYEKVGFQHEGLMRKSIYVDGHYIDQHMMAITFDEHCYER